jgi:ubiquinone/menaquinone biosynthesis C-methylase UbiE
VSVRDRVTADVRAFYEELPFNASSPAQAARRVAAADQVAAYPDLVAVLDRSPNVRVLDIGCGAGWFALSLAVHRGSSVTGIDICDAALELARATGRELGVAERARFVHGDLFDLPGRGARYDVVVALGVLHHTHDTSAALRATAAAVARGGHLYIGLYHAHGRPPFLRLFERWRELAASGRLTAEEADAAFERYRSLNPDVDDQTLLRSWFRDQVLHPHERLHTLGEVDAVLGPLGFVLRSTSLTGFAPLRSVAEAVALEPRQAEISRRRNVEQGRFFPGFFTALYRSEGT